MNIFTKSNNLNNDSLIKEAKGLALLKKTLDDSNNNYIKIPEVISVDREKLNLEKISQTNPTLSQIKSFAVGLSKLHQIQFQCFGFNEDNYIGLNHQKNIISNNWGEFFFDYRLIFQIKMIKDQKIEDKILISLNSKRKTIVDLLNESTRYASLVHGDLWTGNVIFDKQNIYLIDPAVYYADREVDIAMMELFGGFPKEFYEKYNESLQLSKNYNTKKIVYNLYHYLNHYNLFGDNYLSSIYKSLRELSKI